MRLEGIHHAGLAVSDDDAAVAWWNANFGLEQIAKWRDGDLQMGMIDRGEVRIELFCREGKTTTPEAANPDPKNLARPGWNHVAIGVADIDASLAALVAAGATVLTPRAEAPMNFAYAHICDPWGNRIELVERHDDPGTTRSAA